MSPRLPQLALAGLLLSALAPVASAQAPRPSAVLTDVVQVTPIQPRERVIGSLRASATATLAALEEGPLVDVLVKEGESVKAGDLLARTDTRRLLAQHKEQQARIAEAEATLESRRAELDNRRADLEALEAAAKEHAVSQRDLRDARTAIETGSSSLRASEEILAALGAALSFLEIRLADAEVRAPFAARVVERHAEPGEWVRPGDPIATLESVGVIEAWLEVPERLLADLTLDPSATRVDLGAFGERVASRVRVLPKVDPRTRTFFVIVDLPDEEARLSPGFSVDAWIPVGDAEVAVLVPKDALVRRERSVHVMRVKAGEGGESAELVPVDVRFELARHVAVSAGAVSAGVLSAGDRVVVEGNERLLPGAPVIAQPTAHPALLLRDGEEAAGHDEESRGG